MSSECSNFYADFRVRCGVAPRLRDDDDYPPEKLLQAIWQHQRLRRQELVSLDGVPIKVLHPGFQSLEGGPDFRAAVIQFGNEVPRSGDVEVDLHPGGWKSHGHHKNPAFANVILHVVWDGDRPGTTAPGTMRMRSLLDAPLGELSLWLGGEAQAEWPEELVGKCCAPLRQLSPAQLDQLLEQAALVRLRSKASQFHARARQASWEQALWEGVFRALGYKNNVWPMQSLAEIRERWQRNSNDVFAAQARLFGISGLLPQEVSRREKGTDEYVRRVWDLWWRERDEFTDCLLPKGVWRLHGLRPANHPQRRLALAGIWSSKGTLPTRIERWGTAEVDPAELVDSLLEAMQVGEDDYWSHHYTFRSARSAKTMPMLGEQRVSDLAMNVALPWLWARAAAGTRAATVAAIERRFLRWPSAEDNSLLRLARKRLLGDQSRPLRTAARQQGLIQMVRDFCDHSNSLCEACKLPELVAVVGSE
jgi:hypothetical protein